MRRVIEVVAGDVRVRATIQVPASAALSVGEIGRAKAELADRLMRACEDLPYGVGARISAQRVRA